LSHHWRAWRFRSSQLEKVRPARKFPSIKPKGPFYARRTIGIPDLMGHELKPEALPKRGHLGHRHHGPPGAAQHDDVRVVDHDSPGRAAEVPQGLGEKHLAVEASESRGALKEQHPRVAQHRRGGLHLPLFATQFDRVGRSIMLHLLARLEVVPARRHEGCLPDSMSSAEGGQGGIRQRRAAGHQFFMDSHEVPLAGAEKLQDLLPVRGGFLGTVQFRDFGRVRQQDLAHRPAGDS
jgi:hypothetical protein